MGELSPPLPAALPNSSVTARCLTGRCLVFGSVHITLLLPWREPQETPETSQDTTGFLPAGDVSWGRSAAQDTDSCDFLTNPVAMGRGKAPAKRRQTTFQVQPPAYSPGFITPTR